LGIQIPFHFLVMRLPKCVIYVILCIHTQTCDTRHRYQRVPWWHRRHLQPVTSPQASFCSSLPSYDVEPCCPPTPTANAYNSALNKHGFVNKNNDLKKKSAEGSAKAKLGLDFTIQPIVCGLSSECQSGWTKQKKRKNKNGTLARDG
jgi:hypothetical protein